MATLTSAPNTQAVWDALDVLTDPENISAGATLSGIRARATQTR
jgi:hypothetical protein